MSFSINVTSSKDGSVPKVTHSGSFTRAISQQDMDQLGITTGKLKEAIKELYTRSPNDVYLTKPAGKYKLFEKYGWPPVMVEFTVKSATASFGGHKNVAIAGTVATNSSKITANFMSSIENQYSEDITAGWDTQKSISMSESVTVSFGDPEIGLGASSQTTFTYAQSWGQNWSKTVSNTLINQDQIDMTLPPNTSARAEISLNQELIVVDVEFECRIIGTLACNYKNKLSLSKNNSHHFWPFPVTRVFRQAGIPTSFTDKLTLNIGTYTDVNLSVVNVDNGQTLYTIAIDKLELEPQS